MIRREWREEGRWQRQDHDLFCLTWNPMESDGIGHGNPMEPQLALQEKAHPTSLSPPFYQSIDDCLSLVVLVVFVVVG